MIMPDAHQLLLAEALGPQKWALVAVACIIFIVTLLNMNRRRRDNAGWPRHARREGEFAHRESTAVKADLERLLVELSNLSRQINGQIDTRFAKLELSMVDADRRIAQLQRLLEESREAGRLDDERISRAVADANVAARPAASPVRPSLDLRVDDAGIQPAAGTDVPPAMPPESASRPTAAADSLHERIFELSDAGLSVVEIARRTGQSVGEVELILRLRQPAAGDTPSTARGRPGK